MAPVQSFDRTLVGRRGSWKNRLFSLYFGHRRIPWRGGSFSERLFAMVQAVGCSLFWADRRGGVADVCAFLLELACAINDDEKDHTALISLSMPELHYSETTRQNGRTRTTTREGKDE